MAGAVSAAGAEISPALDSVPGKVALAAPVSVGTGLPGGANGGPSSIGAGAATKEGLGLGGTAMTGAADGKPGSDVIQASLDANPDYATARVGARAGPPPLLGVPSNDTPSPHLSVQVC